MVFLKIVMKDIWQNFAQNLTKLLEFTLGKKTFTKFLHFLSKKQQQISFKKQTLWNSKKLCGVRKIGLLIGKTDIPNLTKVTYKK
jgi:hypothetical protein